MLSYYIYFINFSILFQTEEDSFDNDKELTKQTISQDSPDAESSTSDIYDSATNEISESNDIELLKQRQFIEKLQRLSSLKRKSEEFLQKNYYSDVLNTDKRPKVSDKLTSNKSNILQTTFDNIQSIYEENPVEITTSLNPIQKPSTDKDDSKSQTIENELSLKTECDDSDIIVSDPAVCTTPKSYESSREIKKNLIIPMDYQSPQESK